MQKLVFIVVAYLLSMPIHADPIGTVIIVKNKVKAARDNAEFVIKRRAKLEKNDVITTGSYSKTQFRLIDGTLFTLGEKTRLRINEYQFNKENSKAVFELTKGVFRAITGEITKLDNPRFKVKTPMGSIGIHGTEFWGGYLDEGKIDVLFIDGKHPIVVENGYGRVELKTPGEGTTLEPGKAPANPKFWPLQKVQRALATMEVGS